MPIDTNKRITIAQSVNIAKDIAIARQGKNVRIRDIAALVEPVYLKLFKEAATKVALAPSPPAEEPKKVDLVAAAKKAKDLVVFRNENRSAISALPREERDNLEKVLTNKGE